MLRVSSPALPELPEIEHLRRTLAPRVIGSLVVNVELRRRDIVRIPNSRKPVVRVQRSSLLLGDTINQLLRKGKSLVMVGSSGRVLALHMGMTGSMQTLADTHAHIDDPHVHCLWTLQNHTRASGSMRKPRLMYFRDPRRFGGLWPLPSLAALHEHAWSRLGPDALTIDGETLRARLGCTRQPIKAALLNQALIAGVGNIYADEALFASRIHPLQAPSRLNANQWHALATAICTIMQAAIDSGGSTLRDYRDANGQAGWFAFHHHAYGRGGEPCSRCGSLLRTSVIAQRATVHCPSCQSRSLGNRQRHARVIHNGSAKNQVDQKPQPVHERTHA